MLKAYKYRIFPSQTQQAQLAQTFGNVRFVYNLGLETKIAIYTSNKTNISAYDLMKQVTDLKNTECHWLKESPSQALQYSLVHMDTAFNNFFKKKANFPKYKSKHGKQSFSLPQGVSLSEDKKQIFIPKLKLVDIDLHRELNGEIKTVTISKTTTNKYFISILIENNKQFPNKKPIKEKTTIGLDMGIKHFCITSDGEKFENKDFLKSTQKRLRVEQRSLSRKKKGSNHHKKQKLVVALLHEKVRNQRQDYLHKISTYLVNKYDTICLEDLSVKNMTKNHNLAKTISDQGWSEFRSMIEYKSEWKGKNVSIIGRFKPSSKLCSNCGWINKELTLNDREWTCLKCGTKHDRDVNAGKNIKNFGLRNQPLALANVEQ